MTVHEILPVTEVKRDFLKILRRVKGGGEVVAITKDGRAAGILMSPDQYEGLLETIEILQDKDLMNSLRRAKKDSQKGRLYSHEEVFKD